MTDTQYNEGEHAQTCDCLKLQQECDVYKQGWQRAVADYQNLLKENAKMRAEWAAMSEAQILSDFLPVYDNFKKAFAHATQDTNNGWMKGIEFIMKQFGDVLRGHGVEEIKTVGGMFDAAKHEIVGEEESELPEHTIIKEVDGGYMIQGKVIKVAKVVVAKTK